VGWVCPGMAGMPDGRAYCAHYEEGKGSGIRGVRLRVGPKEGVKAVPSGGERN
jgi:hypothetical protein